MNVERDVAGIERELPLLEPLQGVGLDWDKPHSGLPVWIATAHIDRVVGEDQITGSRSLEDRGEYLFRGKRHEPCLVNRSPPAQHEAVEALHEPGLEDIAPREPDRIVDHGDEATERRIGRRVPNLEVHIEELLNPGEPFPSSQRVHDQAIVSVEIIIDNEGQSFAAQR